jgi:hypothetical protein
MKTFRIKLYDFFELKREAKDFAIDTMFMHLVNQKKIVIHKDQLDNGIDRFKAEQDIGQLKYLYFENGLPVFNSDDRFKFRAININGQVIRLKK